jgi:hypothetical protein
MVIVLVVERTEEKRVVVRKIRSFNDAALLRRVSRVVNTTRGCIVYVISLW